MYREFTVPLADHPLGSIFVWVNDGCILRGEVIGHLFSPEIVLVDFSDWRAQ